MLPPRHGGYRPRPTPRDAKPAAPPPIPPPGRGGGSPGAPTRPPNISTARQDHRRYCHGHLQHFTNQPGDVRRCEHGRVQVSHRPYINVLTPEWRTVSRWAEPFLYRRAVRALDT